MKPSRKVSSGIEDLFRSRFENIINLRHELVVLGGRIAWTFFDETYEALYSEEGRPGVSTRLMVGCTSSSICSISRMRRSASAGSTTHTSSASAAKSTFSMSCPWSARR